MAQRTRSTDAEIAYLNSQMLGRIATVGANGRPRVVPAGFSHNPETGTIDLGGVGLTQIRRYRHVQKNPHVAFVVNDLGSTNAWRPCAVQVRGTLTLHEPNEDSGHRDPAFTGA